MFLNELADVPRGTTPFMLKLLLLSLFLMLSACSKPDPNPELKDPIYNEFVSLAATANSELEAEKKALEGFEKELQDVVPQTGQIKFAQKRINDSKAKISRIQQEKKYFELKVTARKALAKSQYAEAFKNKTVWPDPKEWQTYEMEKKFRAAKKTWDVKERMKQLGVGEENTPKPKASGGH